MNARVSKIARSAPAMVSLFDAIGLGPWLSFVTGVIEFHSVRRAAPVMPLVAAIRVAWVRRDQDGRSQ